jgi:hypothetical protein
LIDHAPQASQDKINVLGINVLGIDALRESEPLQSRSVRAAAPGGLALVHQVIGAMQNLLGVFARLCERRAN